MNKIICLYWLNNETVEVRATDGSSELDLGLFTRHELGLLAELFRDLAEELDPQEDTND